jgi:hypothetical protein
MARLVFVGIMAIVGIATTPHESRAITYLYAGVCEAECAVIGLSAGDPVFGTISFADGSLVPGSEYPAPTSFSLDFGTVEISDATAGPFGLLTALSPLDVFPAVVPADLTVFDAALHTGEDPVPPATGGEVVGISLVGTWVADTAGNCVFDDCRFISTRAPVTSGRGSWSVAPVPEPATLSLLVTALIGGLAYRRRFRRGR